MDFREQMEVESARTAWVESKDFAGVRIKVRHISPTEEQKADVEVRALRRKAGSEDAGNEAARTFWQRYIATKLVQDWEIPPAVLPSLIALTSYPEEPLPFNAENLIVLFEENLNLYVEVAVAVRERARFYQEVYEARAKNSKPSPGPQSRKPSEG